MHRMWSLTTFYHQKDAELLRKVAIQVWGRKLGQKEKK